MTELWFWLVTALMLLVSIAIFVIPMYVGKEQNETISRDELNKAFYQDRMDELNDETNEGLVESQQELVIELKQSLLDDIPVEQELGSKKSLSFLMLLPGILTLIILSYALYGLFGNYDKVAAWQGAYSRLPELSEKLLSDTQDTMTDQEMNDLTLSLRTKLQSTPDDGLGWLLLGRIALANRDIQTAEAAMAKAYRFMPDDADVKLGYAQSLLLTGDEANLTQARQLLRDVIRDNHANMQALSLLAFDAFEQGEFEEAVGAWSTMKQLLPKDDARIPMLERSIERAQAQGQSQGKARVSAVAPAIAPAVAPASLSTSIPSEQSNENGVSVTISLAPDVVLPKDAVLIVSVHTPDGERMPVAAKLLPLNSFPVQIDLTDADSMIPERLLSSLPEVRVIARIDSDGNVMTKKGDWFGQSEPFLLGDASNIVINQRF